ncbi:hypothetical protein Poli38472_002581 [Pythium oligandrum]|uniref:Uncharacterized protein n=1 Tax=Pythium oligandrum TaxID=41045 RepID=A0A8K1CI38_PYTOL|nr:hypothetical protein Poli38472_002581 [Pythium oligandrum]|eukprot:TMW63640.1 hypothetical protein Poli38472_002581 [Pythium oligandrum]
MSSEKSSDGGHCGNDKEDDGVCMRKEPKGSENDASTIKKKSPTSATLIKDALKSNLSAVEATTQLKVLCRKFAALMEKVKEETRIREDAEKEVRRLKAIIAGNDAPVIASARAETQAYIHDLKEAYERLKQELRTEKDKNAKLVSKALELEKEKSVLLATNQAGMENRAVPMSSHLDRLGSWDREQVNKINVTLKVTIDELQEELSRKEDEISSYKDRWSRERGRVKELERELQERELAADEEESVATQLKQRLREQQDQCAAFENEVQLSEERLQEALSIRKTLEEQIGTLNDVNLALEQRANVLMRRLELNNSILAECDELKSQLHDSEVDKETLVRSIKELKDQYFRRETDWKCQMEQLRSEKLQLASQITDLQADIASLRAQNALFSEWMLVRKENTAVQLKEQESTERIRRQGDHREAEDPPRRSQAPAAVWPLSLPQKTTRQSYQNYDRDEDDDDDLLNHRYAHTSSRCPLSPSMTKSMTTASPIKQELSRSPPRPPLPAHIYSNHRRRESIGQALSPPRTHASRTRERRETHTSHPSKEPQRSSPCTPGSSKLTDHERLRALMSRNRELQQRLQQETIATRNLEDEITQMTTINTDHKRPSL